MDTWFSYWRWSFLLLGLHFIFFRLSFVVILEFTIRSVELLIRCNLSQVLQAFVIIC